MLALSETHVGADRHRQVAKQLGRSGFSVVDADHAVATEAGGTSGGLLLAFRGHLASKKVAPEIIDQIFIQTW